MHSHNLNIETDCVWGVPSFTPNLTLTPTSTTEFNIDIKVEDHETISLGSLIY